MATIRQYDNGRWQAIVRRKGHPLQSKTFATRSEAYGWSRLIESEMDRGLFLDRTEAERTTLADLFTRYGSEVTPNKRSARRELQRLKLLTQRLGRLSPANLQSKHVSAYRDERLREGKAGASVLKELNTLSHVLDTAIRDWALPMPVNPVRLVRRPTASRGRERRISTAEETALRQACKASGAPFLESLVILAIETAMRLGELQNLDWKHVNLTARVAVLPETKNGQARRVPLSSRAVEVLRAIPRHLVNSRVFWRWSRTDSIENCWRRAVAKAGIADLRFHDLRHEATSRLFEHGLNMMEVAAITGHKTLQMLKRYTHLRAETLVARLA